MILFKKVIPFAVFALCFCIPDNTPAQNMQYAREVINRLASEEMHGRGYVKKGDQIAAEYIKEQYHFIGLNPLLTSFNQSFYIPVNTYPGSMQIKLDKKELIPGIDYIIHPGTRSVSGKYKLRNIETKIKSIDDIWANFKSEYYNVIEFDSTLSGKEKQKIIDYLTTVKYGSGTIILEPKKLTWSVTNSTIKKPIIYVLKSKWNPKSEKITVKIKSKLIRAYKTQNVIGYIPGAIEPDTFIFITAHYDHLGQMGKETYFPGANDNASGVSMLLQLAKYYSQPENKPHYSIVFVCFAAEEAGLLGSKYFVESNTVDIKNIKFLLNMDLLGTGDEGITVVNGTIFEKEFIHLKKINDENGFLIDVKKRGKAANSDHYYFTEAGVPSFFIYTLGGISAYHDVYDKATTLPLTEYENVFKLFTSFVKSLE